jgi:hypothetical protein
VCHGQKEVEGYYSNFSDGCILLTELVHTKPRSSVIYKAYSVKQNIGAIVSVDVLMAVNVGVTVTAAIFWNLMHYNLVNYCHHFRGTICLYLQVR